MPEPAVDLRAAPHTAALDISDRETSENGHHAAAPIQCAHRLSRLTAVVLERGARSLFENEDLVSGARQLERSHRAAGPGADHNDAASATLGGATDAPSRVQNSTPTSGDAAGASRATRAAGCSYHASNA